MLGGSLASSTAMVTSQSRRAARREARRRQIRRRRITAGAVLIAAVIVLVALASDGTGQHGRVTRQPGTSRTPARDRPGAAAARSPSPRLRVASERRLGNPLADGAATALAPNAVLLIGGIDGSGASLGAVLEITPASVREIGALPSPVHDAAAGAIGGAAYLFGGGVSASYSTITRISDSGATQRVGQLPTPASDVAAATVGGTAYIVGGNTGQAALDTIVAWRPGEHARVVARLPVPLRYPAAAADGRYIFIVGGSSGATASRDVLRFDTVTGRLGRLALLPSGLTHAAAAVLNGTLYVLGGRHATSASQTNEILAISPRGALSDAGRLDRKSVV